MVPTTLTSAGLESLMGLLKTPRERSVTRNLQREHPHVVLVGILVGATDDRGKFFHRAGQLALQRIRLTWCRYLLIEEFRIKDFA